ncbi:glycoside hydrolase family 10 protein [Schizophyllum commune H4-8]|uniref:Beta-xylanase n=1 Tax=Schizophyllum commune (strain H4-8 / FGSC 9210) TaxID=578458 RepID=D8Q2R3_SCHCM|nr:glycoside hydrolase family 10 protein [Schizophyllum commune H4-8]KAI5894567.1 glycoside hydrolase family 10 protein [Schizophyllum commune H4-8]
MQFIFALVTFALSVARAGAVPTVRQNSGLNDLFTAKGKLFWGNIGDSNTLNINSNTDVIKSEFGALTPENSMKWESIEPTQGQFSFTGSDALVDFANKNCLLVRGHTLVWHSQLPAYVSAITDAKTLTAAIQSHISGVVGRYSGQFYGKPLLPVLNEDGSLRSSVFSNVLGDSFIATAFEMARAADSTAKLYINDFNLDSNNAKVQAMVKLVNKVNGGGVKLIDGIGSQTHLQAGGSAGVADAISTLASTGCEVAITELDIANAPAADYVAVAQACLDEPKCVSITSWGVSDANSWRASEKPLLFDSSFQKKAAYNSLVQLLS